MFKQIFENTQLALGTLALIASSIIGAYTFFTSTFVTKSQADEMVKTLQSDIKQLNQSNAYNRLGIIQLQLLRMEQSKTLSKTEERLYDNLKKQEIELINTMNKNNW